MTSRPRAVAFLLSLGLTVQVAWSVPPVPADGRQEQPSSSPAILRIRVLEGEGAIHTAGTRSTQPITVFLTDEAGSPVGGASVSLRLPDEGPTGVFANGMRSEIGVTGSDGRVSIRGIQWADAAGPVQLRITANKGDARAGILSTQYVTAPASGQSRRAGAPSGALTRPRVQSAPSSRSKWILIAALIGGAAAGGVAAAVGGGGGTSAAGPAAPPAVTQPTVSIGIPTVTVGKP